MSADDPISVTSVVLVLDEVEVVVGDSNIAPEGTYLEVAADETQTPILE